MNVTSADIEKAREWLREQRAVVHPGPIETVGSALESLAVHVLDREYNERLTNHELYQKAFPHGVDASGSSRLP